MVSEASRTLLSHSFQGSVSSENEPKLQATRIDSEEDG